MGKWFRRAVLLLLGILILAFGADVTLRLISSTEWVRRLTMEKVSVLTGREIQLEKISLSLRGVKLDGLVISEEGGFAAGEFASLERLRLRLKLLHLLHGHFKLRSFALNGLKVNIRKKADGSFNFSSLLPSVSEPPANTKPAEERAAFLWDITLRELMAQRINISYIDEKAQTEWLLKDVFVAIRNFGLDHPFWVYANVPLSYRDSRYSLPVGIGAAIEIYPARLELGKAWAQIQNISLKYLDSGVNVNGRIENFENPSVTLQAAVRNVSDELIRSLLVELPDFFIPEFLVALRAGVQLAGEQVRLHELGWQLPGVQGNVSGWVKYGKETDFQLQADFEAALEPFFEIFPTLQQTYHPEGLLSGTAEFSVEELAAQVALKEGKASLPNAGQISEGDLSLSIKEKMDFREGSGELRFNGKFNKEPFDFSTRFVQTPQILEAQLRAFAKKIALPNRKSPKHSSAVVSSAESGPKNPHPGAWPLPPISLKAHVNVDSLDIPYWYGTGISFQADLRGISPDLKGAQGDLNLSLGKGEIKDLYTLTHSNPVMKVLFLSLGVVGKVFNSLNVFSVLGGLGNGVVTAVSGGKDEPDMIIQTVTGPDGLPMQIAVPRTEQKADGKWAYDKFETAVRFEQGVATVKKGSFVSDMMSFSLSGTTDFQTEKIDMTIHAAPGKHEDDGIMPLTLTVGGTVSEPKGSMSMLGSVSSLVTQGVGNNFVSRSVKKAMGGFFGLFKKKDNKKEDSALQTEHL